MKKIICVVLIIVTMAMMLCGCGSDSREQTGDFNISIWKDKKTGVQYVCYSTGYGGSICPRYDKNGELYVENKGDEK